MRIDDKNMNGVGASGVAGAQGVEGVAQSKSGAARSRQAGGSSDHVELSGLAEQLQAQQPGSEAREAEISRLRELHMSGRYEVDAERVANQLIDEALRETAATDSSVRQDQD